MGKAKKKQLVEPTPTLVTLANGPRRIGFIGDTHCGSYSGLWPEDRIPAKGPFTGTRYLMECYRHMVESWPELDLLVLMGDLIDGQQKKSDGTKLFTTDEGMQVRGAIELLEPLAAKAKRIIRVDGTPYHTGFHGAKRQLDLALGVGLAEQAIDLQLPQGIMSIAHHPPGGGYLYKGSQASKLLLWSIISASRKKLNLPRWVIRAHTHEAMIHWEEDITVILTPCFELPTGYAIKSNRERFQPTLGGVLMTADENEAGGYRVTMSRYDPPLPMVTELGSLPVASTIKAELPDGFGYGEEGDE